MVQTYGKIGPIEQIWRNFWVWWSNLKENKPRNTIRAIKITAIVTLSIITVLILRLISQLL